MADLCTVLRLSEADLAFLRKGFKLDTALRDKGLSMLRPEVISWTTGGHIIEKLRERLSALISKSSWVKNLGLSLGSFLEGLVNEVIFICVYELYWPKKVVKGYV